MIGKKVNKLKVAKDMLENLKEVCIKISLKAYQIGYADAENGRPCDMHYAEKMLRSQFDKGFSKK